MTQLKDVTDLSERQREFWSEIERKVQETYGISLIEFITKEYQVNQSVPSTASKLGIAPQRLSNFMRKAGLSTNHLTILEERVRQEYGVSLQQYIENGFEEYKPLTYLASQLGIAYNRLEYFVKKHRIKSKKKQNSEPIRQELADMQDIVDLDIKDTSCLMYRKQTDWKAISERIKQEYSMSLEMYLLCQHQFNDKSVSDLSLELGVCHQVLRDAMVELGIPLIDYRKKRKSQRSYEQDYEYLMRKYWQDDVTQEQIAKEQGVTKQAISLRMKKLGIKTKSIREAKFDKPLSEETRLKILGFASIFSAK